MSAITRIDVGGRQNHAGINRNSLVEWPTWHQRRETGSTKPPRIRQGKNSVCGRKLGGDSAGALQQQAIERLRIAVQQSGLFMLERILQLHRL
ncbi:hypothetical protein SERPA_00083 (plasmid) [Serratia marcescens]